jgi:hypothetical protein
MLWGGVVQCVAGPTVQSPGNAELGGDKVLAGQDVGDRAAAGQ